MTAADHANTVRDGLRNIVPPSQLQAAHRALDALQAQAEEGQWCRDVFEKDPRSFLDGYLEMETALWAAEAERDRLAEDRDNWHAAHHAEHQRADRLADALREIAESYDQSVDGYHMVLIARAALTQTEHTP